MIEVNHLTKWYGPTLAVDDISFQIDAGQVVGFLGPNGAGKSTTLRILTGCMPATSGKASIAGFDVLTQSAQARANVGYLPENTPVYPEMRVEEYLDFRGRLFEMDRATRKSRAEYVIERCNLTPVRRRAIGKLSRGNRQRVGLAQAILHDPPVLILDEPTASFDPTQIMHFRELVDELRGRHTILLSTHILQEVEKSADRALVIARGRIVAHGTIEQLRDSVAGSAAIEVEVHASGEAVRKVLSGIEGVERVEATEHHGWTTADVHSRDGHDVREAMGRAIAGNGWAIRSMARKGSTLEEFYQQVTAQQHRGVA